MKFPVNAISESPDEVGELGVSRIHKCVVHGCAVALNCLFQVQLNEPSDLLLESNRLVSYCGMRRRRHAHNFVGALLRKLFGGKTPFFRCPDPDDRLILW
jgi:hypothetical protein